MRVLNLNYLFRLRLNDKTIVADKSETAFVWSDEIKQLYIRCSCGGTSDLQMVAHVGTGVQDLEDSCLRCKRLLTARLQFLR